MARLLHLPSSESDRVVVADLKLHLTFKVGALTRTLTVPVPLQLPDMDLRKGVSSARAVTAERHTAAMTNTFER
jgi:hypothetical protein